jgi:amino acid adenylation domain-containing protein
MKIIVAHQPTEKALPAHSAAVVWFDALEPSPAEVIRSKPAVASSSRDLAYVIFTSGSTGRPKGAALERHSVVNLVECLRVPLGYSPDDVFLQFHSFAFDFSVWEIFSALTLGATLVVAPHEVSRSPAALYDLLCAEGVTVLGLTPTALRQLAAERERRGSKPNWRVRLVGVGGEACPKTLPALLRDWGVPLVNFYGPTEATVWATMDFLDPQAPPEAPLAIGRPLPNYETYVLDRCGLPQPVGVPGELYLGGVGLARGYWNRPDLTAERFVPHPFHPDRRLYKTGDRARFLPDGRLEFFGRLDDQVKLRGHRIELGDIETTLLTHPDVADAAVALREDRPGDQRLAAYCCAKKGCRLEVEALRAWLQNKLPGYMIPAVFVFLENLPLSANGKINRRALPVPQSVGGTREMTPPRNSVEKQLADIWREVLGMETVGVHDNFFELGGHSLLMIQIQDGIRRVWNRELSVVSFFKHPTVAEQATLLQGETGADDAPSFARSRAARQIAAARQAVQLRGSEKDHE